MGKKHKHPEHENLERWLVSYADFITLLFATFVVLYALSQADLAKFKQVSQAIKAAFNPAHSIMKNPGGVMKGSPQPKILKDSGNSILNKIMATFPNRKQLEQLAKPLISTIQKINKEISHLNGQNNQGGQKKAVEVKKEVSIPQVKIKIQERGVVLSFASSLFFEPGSAGLRPQAFAILDKVAPDLKKSGSLIHVEGHTDNQSISSAVYPSNWELSAARASSVVRYLIHKDGLDPKTLAAVGYGDTRPTASNDTAEGRSKNRRVDIVILTQKAASQSDAGPAQENEAQVVISAEGEGAGGLGPNPVKPPKKTPPPVDNAPDVHLKINPMDLLKPVHINPVFSEEGQGAGGGVPTQSSSSDNHKHITPDELLKPIQAKPTIMRSPDQKPTKSK